MQPVERGAPRSSFADFGAGGYNALPDRSINTRHHPRRNITRNRCPHRRNKNAIHTIRPDFRRDSFRRKARRRRRRKIVVHPPQKLIPCHLKDHRLRLLGMRRQRPVEFSHRPGKRPGSFVPEVQRDQQRPGNRPRPLPARHPNQIPDRFVNFHRTIVGYEQSGCDQVAPVTGTQLKGTLVTNDRFFRLTLVEKPLRFVEVVEKTASIRDKKVNVGKMNAPHSPVVSAKL